MMPPCAGTVYSNHWRGGTGPLDHLVTLSRRGDDALEAGNNRVALAAYRDAAAAVVAAPKPILDDVYFDEMLHVGRHLAVLRDAATAQVLWKIYLAGRANRYVEQAQRLRSGDARGFFTAMAADSAHFTGGHPWDDETAAAIARGVAAGRRGDLLAAQKEFAHANAAAVLSQAYAMYAYGATAWLRGDFTQARHAWICASDADRDANGDMAFNGAGNLAAVTMLVRLR